MAQTEQAQGQFRTIEEAVEWVTGRQSFGIKPGLKRMEWMMERLEHPERRLKFIHVAGTNGKGSTCAYLSQVLRQCGYDVGTFTSPFLERFNNRMQYNLEDIDDGTMLSLINRVKPLADELEASELGAPTMFEITTAVAILYYATVCYPDYVVWETGLGGRLDSTNIVVPVITVITNIGHDHQEILGDSLEQIAAEKAGIIKPGVPLVTAVEQPEAFRVIEETAKSRKATVYALGREFRAEPQSVKLDDQVFTFEGPFRAIPDVHISLNGPHQMKNAAVALMTLEVLRQYYALIVEDEDLRAGMQAARWKGRLETVSRSPRIVLDGAHNPEGAETLAAALRSGVYGYRKLNVMLGMLETKKHSGFLRHILPLADTLIVTEPEFRKAMSAEALAELAREEAARLGLAVEVTVERDWKQALDRLQRLTGEEDLAVVTGTLYMISDVRSRLLGRRDSDKGW
ncbi:bifunctional folylpolyglutamate synthase/dihydrofolate synthase [Paenibacillus thermoaerophilus]|uniref:tetrahydrofolate synthase n=1 Tax=Paenibacillus thermoaerophilus TaxID=1215385 RepID=A0ABW2V309_9BACL|nr:folylpolyglutamate synthase/dihydrofolate synthase family protein [Paenibacillus thermoaerophilus]TMV11105.1 bifunctional folylpolyglutamate synthase/dihydrofolate synthase [Paenibacillus thermoaerophilus]